MPMPTRLAAAAVIGVLAVGGAFYLFQPGQPAVGGPGPTPARAPARPSSRRRPASPRRRARYRPSLTGPMGTGRQIHTATRLADGRVLVAGGYGGADVAARLGRALRPEHRHVQPDRLADAARGLHTATLLADGRVLIAGGGPASWVDSSARTSASVELYDPKTGTFSHDRLDDDAREDHTATLLADGRVLIAGGNDVGDHAVASAELYDPTTGTFTPTGSMATARGFHTATLLADGRVLDRRRRPRRLDATGAFLASAEIYDPTTGTFSPTGSMAVGRASTRRPCSPTAAS